MPEEVTNKAEETKNVGRKPKNKKSWPTNCTQTSKRIRRKDWYYRNGKFFGNKQAYRTYVVAQAKKAEEAKAAEAKKAEEAATPKAS